MPLEHPDSQTLILSRSYIENLATPADYFRAVEQAFRDLAAGTTQSLPVGHVPAPDGAFHVKAARSARARPLVAIKINGNFPGNPQRNGLPTIQGCVALADAGNGRLLALMDSIEITARRTAAASAVAASHLARADSTTLALIGCGTQARHHLAALLALERLRPRRVTCFDADADRAANLASMAAEHGLGAALARTAAEACRDADIVVTTTPAAAPILMNADISAGCFIAAVGADNPSKCELAPALMARARVVPDILDQAATMGDLRCALAAGAMRREDVHAELAQVVSGARSGRTSADEVFVFDSTGTAIEDLAAAAMLYDRARADPGVHGIAFN